MPPGGAAEPKGFVAAPERRDDTAAAPSKGFPAADPGPPGSDDESGPASAGRLRPKERAGSTPVRRWQTPREMSLPSTEAASCTPRGGETRWPRIARARGAAAAHLREPRLEPGQHLWRPDEVGKLRGGRPAEDADDRARGSGRAAAASGERLERRRAQEAVDAWRQQVPHDIGDGCCRLQQWGRGGYTNMSLAARRRGTPIFSPSPLQAPHLEMVHKRRRAADRALRRRHSKRPRATAQSHEALRRHNGGACAPEERSLGDANRLLAQGRR